MTFQYSPAAWAARQAQLNAANGTSFNIPAGAVNAILIAGEQDGETVRVIRTEFSNLTALRDRIAGVFGAGYGGVTDLTTTLQSMQTRYADYIPAVPPVNAGP